MAKILILEDTIDVVDTLKGMLADQGHEVAAEMRPEQVMETIRRFKPDLVTLDISFGDKQDDTGIALLQEIRTEYSKAQLPVLVVSGTANADKLTRMIDLDISGYINKAANYADLLKKINEVVETKTASKIIPGPWEARMVGESPAILELVTEIGKAAKAQSDLLITGETGSGKEQVVQKYRELSPRRDKPFVVIDCTNISQGTFESEIFGHEKGSFTGAVERKRGKIEAAGGGIVFFDEIGDLPEQQQPKLLRLLQNKTFTRVGSNEPVLIDVVVLAATNQDLQQLMQQGKFRKDLYYRLKYMKIEMPPLREHLEDIPSLTDHFILKYNQRYHKSVTEVDQEVIRRFQQMPWDGNVRDLEQCIAYGLVKGNGLRLQWQDVAGFFNDSEAPDSFAGTARLDLNLNYEQFNRYLDADREAKERTYYLHYLNKNDFNVSKTADELGVVREYLYAIMKRLGIKRART